MKYRTPILHNLPIFTKKAVCLVFGREILPILRDLAERYGAPLVLKSDNGSAFIASLTQLALTNLAVVQLFSPPACPQYNGELERSNGTLKDSTHAQALLEGHPSRWTSHNLDQARCLANNCSRPWGPTGPTPQEAWNARTPITAEERARFLELLEQHRVPARHEVGCDGIEELNHYAKSEIDRLAISRTLQELGLLEMEAVRRPAPRAKRPKREDLAPHLLAKNSNPSDPAPAAVRPTTEPPSSDTTSAAPQESVAAAVATRDVEKTSRLELESSPPTATIRASVETSTTEPRDPKETRSAQREPTIFSCLRRLITPAVFRQIAATITWG